MYTTTSLPSPDSVQLDRWREQSDGISLELSASRPAVPCPDCAQLTDHVHSYYQRRLAGLPISGQFVTIKLTSRKFFCCNGACTTRIFTERLPGFVDRYSRRTLGLHASLQALGLALGGREGARLAEILGFCGGRDTILRGLRRWVRSKATGETKVRHLGVDDWAKRKGQCYGTILVDLDRHVVIDLLSDRTKETLEAWLKNHPEVEIISRDRGGAYAEAGREAAPQATQVADRFHLSKNMVDLMERLLAGERKAIREMFETTPPGDGSPECPGQSAGSEIQVVPLDDAPGKSEQVAEAGDARPEPKNGEPENGEPENACVKTNAERVPSLEDKRRERKLERYQAAKELHNKGVSVTDIARQLAVGWRTAQRLIRADSFPEAASRTKPSRLKESHREYLDERWKNGCLNGAKLFRELKEKDYKGGYMTVSNYLKVRWRSNDPSGNRSRGAPKIRLHPSARQLAWLLLYPEKTLANVEKREGKWASQQQADALAKLTNGDSPLKKGMLLAREFVEMVTKRQPEALDDWLRRANESGTPELVRFVTGIKQDYDAVRAGLTLDISNGQVEGQVNKLKMKKRQMYGRAGMEILRARVISPI